MRERPILFNGDMVRAILEGRKTVTRRAISWRQTPFQEIVERDDGSPWPWREDLDRGGDCWYPCPFGRPGDRLWVRENWWQAGEWQPRYPMVDECVWHGSSRVVYSADGLPPSEPNRHFPNGAPNGYTAADPNVAWRHRPSIHMPRWASRILLEVTAVRVERLQDITEEQAQAEGADPIHLDGLTASDIAALDLEWADPATPFRNGFRQLWESLGGNWHANPWVWVIEFKLLEVRHA